MLRRTKSFTPIDRAPEFRNRPSSSPVRLMVRPHSALQKTIGEDARQFSSFTEDGFFPEAYGANKAQRGRNEIDRQLEVAARKQQRAQSATLREKEHRQLEEQYAAVACLPKKEFLVRTPTTDPIALKASLGLSESIVGGSRLLPDNSMCRSHHSQMGRVSPVPITTPGSRPSTPLVYLGGRVQPDLRALPSRPNSASVEGSSPPRSSAPLVVSTTAPAASGNATPPVRVSSASRTRQAGAATVRDEPAAPVGHLRTFVVGSELPQWVLQKLAERDAALHPSRPVSPSGDSGVNTLHTFTGGSSSADAQRATVTSPNRKQRHQTPTKRGEGFNISTSTIVAYEADELERGMSGILRSRPSSAVGFRSPLTSAPHRPHVAIVYPLRSVFLH